MEGKSMKIVAQNVSITGTQSKLTAKTLTVTA